MLPRGVAGFALFPYHYYIRRDGINPDEAFGRFAEAGSACALMSWSINEV